MLSRTKQGLFWQTSTVKKKLIRILKEGLANYKKKTGTIFIVKALVIGVVR